MSGSPVCYVFTFSFRSEVGTIFALSWLITWFGHVLSEFKHTLRLYDFFLASHPLMPIYLAATVRSHRSQQETNEQGGSDFVLSVSQDADTTHMYSYLTCSNEQIRVKEGDREKDGQREMDA